MSEQRIKISQVVDHQLPSFIRNDFPFVGKFLEQYYKALEYQSGPLDLLQNIDQYNSIDTLIGRIDNTTLTADVETYELDISVASTEGFPDSYGLLRIGNEVISYTGRTSTKFTGCVRGFSGVTSYKNPSEKDSLVFSNTLAENHSNGDTVTNLSVLFLQEFLKKVKTQIAPGFEDRELSTELNQRLFLKQTKDFYSSKGTDISFQILFGALFGESVEVVKPRDLLVQPSDAQYRISKDIVVEAIEGNPEDLKSKTLFQDSGDGFDRAQGTIANVENILRGGKTYYVISLDYEKDSDPGSPESSLLGSFQIHPKTQLTTGVSVGATVLDVDSTVGFSTTGTIVARVPGRRDIKLTYQDKSLTQFFGVSGVSANLDFGHELRVDNFAYGYAGIGTENPVKVRVGGVLSDLDILEKNYYYERDDQIDVKTLGTELSDLRSNSWFFNVSGRFDVEKIELTNSANFTYKLSLYDEHNFNVGDPVTILSSDSNEFSGTLVSGRISNTFSSSVVSFDNNRAIEVKGQGVLDTTKYYTVRRDVAKVKSTNYPSLDKIEANVQNSYTDLKNCRYVAAPSLPSYPSGKIAINDRTVTFSGTFSGEIMNITNHGFYSGDVIAYSPADENNKLNLIAGIYYVEKININQIKLARSVENIYTKNYVTIEGTVTDNSFHLFKFASADLSLKNVQPQKLIRKIDEPYKGNAAVYPTEPGALGILVNGVEISNYKAEDLVYYGEIQDIEVISPGKGYDVMNPPVLSIADDTGSGCVGVVTVTGGLSRVDVIDAGFNYIEEPVITINGGGGTGAVAKANLIPFKHDTEFNSTTVDLSNNQIGFTSFHKFRNAEQVIYDPQGQDGVTGLTTDARYFVEVVNATTVKLFNRKVDAQIGINTVQLTATGTGIQRFRSVENKNKVGSVSVLNPGSGYTSDASTPLTVTISGRIGIATFSGQDFNARIDAHFRGPISGVNITNGGIEYGAEKLLNYERQPIFTLNSGSGAEVLSVVQDGKIVDVFVTRTGSGYNSSPDLVIDTKTGKGAVLVPVVENGQLIDVKVVFQGLGYEDRVPVGVVAAGSEARFEARIKKWRVNQVERLISTDDITDDDGVIDSALSEKYGLKYTHAYASRYLRASALGKEFSGGNEILVPDLRFVNGAEVDTPVHSPILGWAYDGNPIYGPYGYIGNNVQRMRSGYQLILSSERPTLSEYPAGFFVEDYTFNNSGDLDAHNGKFGPTPEYPEGVYAYFTTISGVNDSVGPFRSFRRPQFPYIIGDSYKSKPIEYNYNEKSNQDEIDLNATGWSRNTTPYNLSKSRSYYDFVIDPDRIKKQITVVSSTTRAGIQTVGIVTGGINYNVGDNVVFKKSTSGGGAIAKVESLKGKQVTAVSISTVTDNNVQLVPLTPEAFTGFTTDPHGYSRGDIIAFSGSGINTEGAITVRFNQPILATGVGTAGYTGIATFINIIGNVADVQENDIYQLFDEDLKVLNVDTVSNRLRVLREQNGTVSIGTAIAGIALTEKPRRFTIPLGITSSTSSIIRDRQLYFDPSETCGVGLLAGPGITSSLVFTNPGAGITSIEIPTKTFFIPNHGLKTGDAVTYSSGSSPSAVGVSTIGSGGSGITEGETLYIGRVDSNLFEIALVPVGVGTTGSFVGVAESHRGDSTLFITSPGTGDNHSFTTVYPASKLIEGTTVKHQVTVSTGSTHGLKKGDSVTVAVRPGIITSKYSGTYAVSGVAGTQFNYTIPEYPEQASYNTDDGELAYSTKSKSAFGSIKSVIVTNSGRNYARLPGIDKVTSGIGTGAVLEPYGVGIGSIRNINILDIGFDYPSDNTLRPTAQLPEILNVENLFSYERIGITSVGRNYLKAPDLVVVDRITKSVVKEAVLEYELGDTEVSIIENSKGISSKNSEIIPINNTNGVGISTIKFDSGNKNVIVTLGSSFSNASNFPFDVGDKVLVENISVGIGSTAKGFNSRAFNYELFQITATDPNIGGIGATITYNINGLLGVGETTGLFDPINSDGRIVPQKHFPLFDIEYQDNEFFRGEHVITPSANGRVMTWDADNGDLKIATNDDFVAGERLIGGTSGTQAVILDVINFKSIFKVGASSIVKKGWQTETGFLNNSLQRTHDNDYYQYFAYDLKSKVAIDKWGSAVEDLNHTSGFKKFGNMVVESDIAQAGLGTDQNGGDFFGFGDIASVVDTNCENDIDLVRENNIFLDKTASNQVIFNNIELKDYLESVGNRVLMIDDLADEFNSNPRVTKFSTVDTFKLNTNRFRKYLVFINDVVLAGETQSNLLALLHDDSFGYVNQYARLSSAQELGSFDFTIVGDEGAVLFYPNKTEENDYDITLASFSTNDLVESEDIDFGTSVSVAGTSFNVGAGTTTATNVVQIPTTERGGHLILTIKASDGSYIEVDELNYVHDGTDVHFIDYGQLDTGSLTPEGSTGIGTYGATISGGNVNFQLTPFVGLSTSHTVNTLKIVTSASGTGIGSTSFLDSEYRSTFTQIAASGSPTATTISEFNHDSNYRATYCTAVITDTTNTEYQITELAVMYNDGNAYLTQFGDVFTNIDLGDFTVDNSGALTQLKFTPNASTAVDIRVFQQAVANEHNTALNKTVDLNNAGLNADFGSYVGAANALADEFELTSRQVPIFERYFFGNDSNVVDLDLNTVEVPRNFYVTGEELEYTYQGADASTENAVGIATTTITGIGLTDKLPRTLYAIKDNERQLRFAGSALDALAASPKALEITAVGIGTSHSLSSKNTNSRCLISVDNMVQSPIVATAVTTTLSNDVKLVTNQISLTGITSIFSGDVLKVDNELMKVDTVGYGAAQTLLVRRGHMGSGIQTHSSGDLVFKMEGNYNISKNKIHFSQAPYGSVPFTNPTNRYDEQDYVGLVTGSTFSGRVFTKSGELGNDASTYGKNYLFDDISEAFSGSAKDFILRSQGNDIAGFSTSNAVVLVNGVFQMPRRQTGVVGIDGDYFLTEGTTGITTITFTGDPNVSTDINTAKLPRSGQIVSVGSTAGFGFQPLVAAGGTATVSVAGTISAISIGNTGSGYRPGVQPVVNVGVGTTSLGTPNIEFIGTAAVQNGHVVSIAITNPGAGYTSTNPPVVFFDAPLSYNNIPLIYADTSITGFGSAATADIVVGNGSSVINFEIRNTGYSYGQGETLTVAIGGTVGIPTNTSLTYEEFQISVDRTHRDLFAGWNLGDLQVMDPIESLFDGQKKVFPLKINREFTTIKARKGSNIDIQATMIVFINDVLQVPGLAYEFEGGSLITFTEAPAAGDTCKIIFYKGNGDRDVIAVDVLERIKVGDGITLNSDDLAYQQNERFITKINATDNAFTDLYFAPGVATDDQLERPAQLCRMTEDAIINGVEVGKDRAINEPQINPVTTIISPIGVSTDRVFVESVKTFFDNEAEYLPAAKQNKSIFVIDQDVRIAAAATATVSIAGTITEFTLSSGGVGYSTAPHVMCPAAVGLGTTARAQGSATIVDGVVTSISVLNAGLGYTFSNPPAVLIEAPTPKRELMEKVDYEGDFGDVVGVKTTSNAGIGVTFGLVFDLIVPPGSFIRDTYVNNVGMGTTGVPGVQENYRFVVSNSNVGSGVTSLDRYGNVVSVGSSFIDNTYEAVAVSVAQTSVLGLGQTYVAQVTVNLEGWEGLNTSLSGVGMTNFYGEYSWGLISGLTRKKPQSFTRYNNGLAGVSTSPLVQRSIALKHRNYTT